MKRQNATLKDKLEQTEHSVQEFIGEMGLMIDMADLTQSIGAPPVECSAQPRVDISMQNPRS